jgi:hypothetical protein
MFRHIAALVLAAPMAAAACPDGSTTFLSCTMSGGAKALDVCYADGVATYAFGPAGKTPDLALAEPIATLDYVPWPGIGSAIWETVTFRNAGYAYEVAGSIRRGPDETTADDTDMLVTQKGQISVMQGDRPVATLLCDPGSVSFDWTEALSDGKRAAGYELDQATREWVRVTP